MVWQTIALVWQRTSIIQLRIDLLRQGTSIIQLGIDPVRLRIDPVRQTTSILRLRIAPLRQGRARYRTFAASSARGDLSPLLSDTCPAMGSPLNRSTTVVSPLLVAST